MTHIWVRAEQREHEERVGLTPQGAAKLLARGFQVSVEDSSARAISIDGFRAAGCRIVPENSWPDAPDDTIIFGLKELPDDGTPLRHRHIMFGHAYKGQKDGKALLKRFQAGNGALYDLEYLVGEDGRRVAAFGYWAGYAGAAVSLKCWAAQKQGTLCRPVSAFGGSDALVAAVSLELDATELPRPTVIIVGALGRVGKGARDLCAALGIVSTDWDMADTADGGPFPEILAHDIFLNCILAAPGCPVFVPASAKTARRKLGVIGDIACDPTSEFSPIRVYRQTTTWGMPALRVHDDPPLDVTAIDNLPSMLPVESSNDFAAQLLPWLTTLDKLDAGIWRRARSTFDQHMAQL